MPWGICGSMSTEGTYGSAYWRRPCIWQHAAPRSSSWLRPSRRSLVSPVTIQSRRAGAHAPKTLKLAGWAG